MNWLEWLLLIATVGIAIRVLVQMMRQRAAMLVEEVQQQVDSHRTLEKQRQKKARLQAAQAARSQANRSKAS